MRDICEALKALKTEGVVPGPACEQAHLLAQNHAGDAAYDRLHALVHRIGGDLSNAAYWYRCARAEPYAGDVGAECDLLIERFSGP